MPKGSNSSSRTTKAVEEGTAPLPRSQLSSTEPIGLPAKRASKSTAYEKHLWMLDKPTAGRKRGQSNASIHEADAAPAGKKTKPASQSHQASSKEVSDEEDLQPRPPTTGHRRRRLFRAPKLTDEFEDDEDTAGMHEHAEVDEFEDIPEQPRGDRRVAKPNADKNASSAMPPEHTKGDTGKKVAMEDEVANESSSSESGDAHDAELEEDSGSEKSEDVEWGAFSQKAVMAETPMWVDGETKEPSTSSHIGTKTRTTHRRHTSTTSLSSCVTDPPSSADGDSGKERAPSRSLASRHGEPFSDCEDDSTQPSRAQSSKKSTAMYGYRHTGQKPKKTSRAQAAQEAETPQWDQVTKSSKESHKHHRRSKSKAAKVEEAEDNVDNAAERPPTAGVNDDIELVYPDKQWTELPIGLQRPRVRKVARCSIYKVSRSILFENAFPDDGTAQALYTTKALVETASELGYADIKARLLMDEQYAHDLATIPGQRISTLRGPVKRAAFSTIAPVYSLQPGPSCKGDVDWLLESLRYIYPLHSAKGDTPVQKRRPVSTMPFQNEAILEVVSACFFSGKPSIAEKYKMEFGSSLEDAPDELELPASMLALASTAVGSSITDWRSGTRPKKAKGFSADANQDLYNANIKVLNHLRSKEQKKYHVLMHGLYVKLSDGISLHDSGHDADGAIALLDLDGMSG